MFGVDSRDVEDILRFVVIQMKLLDIVFSPLLSLVIVISIW